MTPMNPNQRPPQIKKPEPITISRLGKRLQLAAGDFGTKHILVGLMAWVGATFLHMPAAKLIAGKNYFLSDEQKKENDKNKLLLEKTIAGIEKRQAEIGGKFLPEDTPESIKRMFGAPVEMGRRWLGWEDSKDISVIELRARLTGIILEDAYYEMKALLAYWLLFIAIIYYLTEPIGILLNGRREVKNRKDIADQATAADEILYQNNLTLQAEIEKLRREYLELMQYVVELNLIYLEGEIDPVKLKQDLINLHRKILSTLDAMNKALNQPVQK